LLREPGGRPAGFPLWPFSNVICLLLVVHPRGRWIADMKKPRRGFPPRA
jgi:hypothetical protein